MVNAVIAGLFGALGGVVGLASASAQSQESAREVSARVLRIVDSDGEERVRIGSVDLTTGGNDYGIVIRPGKNGPKGCDLTVGVADGGLQKAWFRRVGGGVECSLGQTGEWRFVVREPEGHLRMRVEVHPRGPAHVELFDKDGKLIGPKSDSETGK